MDDNFVSKITNNVSEDLVTHSFLPSDGLPLECLQVAEYSFFDWLVVSGAGSDEPVASIVKQFITQEGGNPISSVVGQKTKTSPHLAALANGTISHALDYDDTHFHHIGHLSAAIIPAVLALGESTNKTYSQVIESFLVGAESAILVGEILGMEHYKAGFHQTATAGCFGATIAICRLLHLTETQRYHALGLVSTMASGLKSQFGTMGKPFNAGIAASNAVKAAKLSELNFISNPDGLGSSQGFIETHSPNTHLSVYNRSTRLPFRFDKVNYKLHACCHGLHAAIEALNIAKTEKYLSPQGVRAINITVSSSWRGVCDIEKPQTGLQGKFSYHYVAALVICGFNTAALDSFFDEMLANIEINNQMRKITVSFNENMEDSYSSVIVHSEGLSEKNFEFDLKKNQKAIDAYPRLKDKAESLLDKEKTK
ncbi:MAG: MmgE/PrpD family protein, partial [Alphaproteobacteria bacterium]